MTDTLKTVQRHTTNLYQNLVHIRRELHQHPELSGKESWTANFIAEKLEGLGLSVHKNIGGHGLFADLITDPEKPSVALRVDIDALPIHESNQVTYRSKFPGVMHACGHDAHTTIGIGSALVLTKMAEKLQGNIRFIFQPEEEEITGALRMIRGGALLNPTPKAIIGFHVAPIPVGKIAWSDGLFLAGFDHYLVILTPKEGISLLSNQLDAIAQRCCQVIQGFNDWHLPETWDEMQAFWQTMQNGPDNLRNFIVYDATPNIENPSAWHGQFGIGIKAANRHLRRAAIGRVKASLNTICQMTHTDYHIKPMGTMIDMYNDTCLVQSALSPLNKAIGPQNMIQLNAAFPFNCEDFAFYTRKIPGAMYWLGAANPAKGKYAMLHTPDFDIDEKSLKVGTAAMSFLLLSILSQTKF